MWFANEIPMHPTRFAGRSRLVLEIDGPDSDYQALLFSGESQATPPARVPITAGVTSIELDSIGGLDLARLRAIGVFAGGPPRAFDFAIRRARLE